MDLLPGGCADTDPAPDEDPLEALDQFYEEVGPAFRAAAPEARWGVTGHLVEWQALINAAVPALCTALGVWLGSRNGRKVRIKVGDTEVEAQTPEEVEKLLAHAQQIQQENQLRNQPPKIIVP
jgi:hypothetical protein